MSASNHRTLRAALPAVLLILTVVFMIGCTPPQPTPTPDLPPMLEACPLPCFAEITLGETTNEEAVAILNGREHSLFVWNRAVDVDPGEIEWEDRSTSDLWQGTLAINDGVVTLIELEYRSKRITAEEIITEMGEPEFVDIPLALAEQAECTSAQLVYPALGARVTLNADGDFAGVRPTQFVDTISLSEPSDLGQTDTARIEWQGYVDYCALT